MLWTPRLNPQWPTNKSFGTTSWSDRPSMSTGFSIQPNAASPTSAKYVVNNAHSQQEILNGCRSSFGPNAQNGSKEILQTPRINGSRASFDPRKQMLAVSPVKHTDPAIGDAVPPIAVHGDESKGQVGEPKIKEHEKEKELPSAQENGSVQCTVSEQRDEIAELKAKISYLEEKNIESTRALSKRTDELVQAQHRIVLLEQDLERVSGARNQLESQLKNEHFQLVNAQLLAKETQRKFDKQVEERLPVPFEPGLCDRLHSLRSELDRTCSAIAEMQKAENVANESDFAAEDNEMIDLGGESVFQMPSRNSVGAHDVCNDDLTYDDPIDTFMRNGTSPHSELPTPVSGPSRVSMRLRQQGTPRRTSSISSTADGFMRPMCSSMDAASADVKRTPRRSLQFRDLQSTPGSSQPTPRRMVSDTQLPSPTSESEWTSNRKNGISTRSYELENITVRDLSEIKALKRPPESLRLLMEVCCLLMNVEPDRKCDAAQPGHITTDYWEPAGRVMLSDPFFLSKLKLVDPGDISTDVLNKIRDYFDHRSFTPERLRKCSKPAAVLYDWIKGLVADRLTHPGINATQASP